MGDVIGWIIFCSCGWIIVGGLAGGIARFIMRSEDKPFVNDLLLGIVGAIVGSVVMRLLGWSDNLDLKFGLGFFITSTIGAMILIAIGNAFMGNKGKKKR